MALLASSDAGTRYNGVYMTLLAGTDRRSESNAICPAAEKIERLVWKKLVSPAPIIALVGSVSVSWTSTLAHSQCAWLFSQVLMAELSTPQNIMVVSEPFTYRFLGRQDEPDAIAYA